MDDVTTSALQLFSEDQHPAASKSGKSSASKEGLSIYALLSRTSCAMSAHVLRRILLRPLKDPQILTGRYALVAWGVEPINLETVRKLQNAMKMIINVPRVMNRLRRGHLTIHDWKMLHSSLFHSIVVGEICQAQDQYIPIFKEVSSCQDQYIPLFKEVSSCQDQYIPIFKEISESMTDGIYYSSFLIQRIMDVEQSQREGRFVVKPGVHPELDESEYPHWKIKHARQSSSVGRYVVKPGVHPELDESEYPNWKIKHARQSSSVGRFVVKPGVHPKLDESEYPHWEIKHARQSSSVGRFVVKPGVHPELDEKKRRYSGLADLMHRVAATELRRLPPEVDSCSIVYIPHVGYLLAISSPSLEESLRDNDYNLPGLKFMFKADNLMLYKSFTCCGRTNVGCWCWFYVKMIEVLVCGYVKIRAS
ncbi:hypothetical protein SK128_003475 [Halocaridina rubra]|uniref:DNA mismatch repair protein MutS core domain-containing protein n=1 Tax=Halocaridina rubra TaxID=373956 RepID=A0AAN9A3P3_HALRR